MRFFLLFSLGFIIGMIGTYFHASTFQIILAGVMAGMLWSLFEDRNDAN